jgi:glycosyltransferase involved in cell wall biosynthesis
VRVALVPDCKGWAWDKMAHGLRNYAPDWCECEILYPAEIDAKVATSYDAVLNFSWIEANTRIDKRLVALVASHSMEYMPWASTLNKTAPDWRNEEWRACVASRLSNEWTAANLFGRFSGLIAVSERLAVAAAKVDGSPPVAYIPAAIDPKLWPYSPPRPPGDSLRVGWCGQYDEAKPDPKGVSWILEPLKRRMGRDIEFVLNMRPPQRALNQAEMRAWYRSIDVFLVTSISEGTPMTALEAMSMGRPVLGTNVGDLPNIVRTHHSGVLLGEYHGDFTADRVVDEAERWLQYCQLKRHEVARMGRNAAEAIRRERDWRYWAPRWLAFVAGGKDDRSK